MGLLTTSISSTCIPSEMVGESSDMGISGEDVELMNAELTKYETTIIEPKVGMKFDNIEEMFQVFKEYAKYMGFPVKKRSSKRNDDGNLRSVTFACGRGGKAECTTSNPLKPQPRSKTECKVRLTSSLDRDGKWRINNLVLEHNHALSPSLSRFFQCFRKINDHARRQLEINDIVGIDLPKSHNSFIGGAGGQDNVTFLEDTRNCVDKTRKLCLEEGDVIAIQNYFLKMQAPHSNFFFSMDLDEDSRLRNVFWADGRSREAYKEFGDLITFDTTYLTNKYKMPFVSFLSVNHHGQSILLGCGLISNEDTQTFVWLFRTWLACMSDCTPEGIITDQGRAIQSAVEIVFPTTRHRWCLWHVMKKMSENFGSHPQKESICKKLQSCVYDTQSPEEFEESWNEMLDMFDFHENDCLSGLYDDRHRWVPCYLKISFWAGMSTTQQSESVNSFFDGYINAKTTLKQFVEKYSYALKAKVEKETHADFKSFSQIVPCATTYEIEKQLQSVYTIKKFKEFQEELTSKMYCEILDTQERDMILEYVVQEDVAMEDVRKWIYFTVIFQKDKSEVSCSCRRFEFRGILCRHALSVLIRNRVKLLPEKYILYRWRKDALRSHTRVRVNYDGSCATTEQLEYDSMCHEFTKVANLAADDADKRNYIKNWLETQKKELWEKKMKHGNSLAPTV